MDFELTYIMNQMCGIATACAHYLMLRRLFTVKRHIGKRGNSEAAYFLNNMVLFGVSFLIVGMIIFISDWGNLPPTLLVYTAGILFACEGSRAKRLTLSVMLSSTVFAVNTMLDNFVWRDYDYGALTFERFVFAVFFYLVIRIWGPDAETELGDSLWYLLLLLSLTPLGIVVSVVLLPTDHGNSIKHMRMYLALLLLAVLSLAGLLWAIKVLERQRKLERQNLYAQMNQNYYEAMRQQHFEIRRLRHDLSNHLQALSVLRDEERTDYIASLLGNPAFVQRVDYCGEPTVNAVLSAKEEKMREAGISLSLKLELPEELPFEKADTCAVFANALDNAIEGCLAAGGEQCGKPVIYVEAREQSGMFVLSVRNPSRLSLEKGVSPRTTKADAKHHGYGLGSINEIAARYHGKLELNTEDGMFELFLYLPTHESSK